MRLAILAIAALLAQAAPPQQPPTYRAGTDLVEVDVRVVGKDGRFVADLKPEDFQLLEDGAPQKIRSLVLIEAAAGAGARSVPGAAAPKPAQAASQAEAGQTWIFFFDTNHLTPAGLKRTRDAVSQFIAEKFHDGDLAGVIADGKMANNRLTSDRNELKKAVDAVKKVGEVRRAQVELKNDWPRLQDEYEAIRIAVDDDRDTLEMAVERACTEEPDQCRGAPADAVIREKAGRIVRELQRQTLSTLTTLQGLSNGLARIAGPKSIVFVSEGFLIERMESNLQQVVGMANRAGAHVYAIDARGLNKGANADLVEQKVARSTIGAGPSFDSQEDGPNSLAVDTGGFVVRNENNFGRALDEIQADAGTYYVLGYMPANPTFDGKYRKISVNVSRSDVKVRARAGYLALAPAKLLRAEPIAPSAPAPVATVAVVPSLPETPFGAEPVPGATPSAETLAQFERLEPNPAESAAASLGWNAYQRGDVVTAATEFRSAVAEPGARPWVFYALGMSEFAQQRYRESVAAWERVRVAVPDFEPVYFHLADAYMLQHDEGTAINVLREAQKRWSKDPEVLNAIGVIQVRRGALDAAIESLEQATVVAPSDALAYYNLGRAHQLRMLKSVRYDRVTEKWLGGEADRKKAAEYFEKYISIGGPFVQQAREALAQLAWK